jgi:hypothetical protein
METLEAARGGNDEASTGLLSLNLDAEMEDLPGHFYQHTSMPWVSNTHFEDTPRRRMHSNQLIKENPRRRMASNFLVEGSPERAI